MNEPVRIVVDTREQCPYGFEYYDATTETAALAAGDYSLPGFVDRVAVERKSLDDLIGCLKDEGRVRFEKELQRLSRYELGCIVVEAALADVRAGRYRSEMRPESVCQSVFAFQIRYRVPFIWAGDRAGGEYVTFSLLQKYAYEIRQRFKMLERNRGDATPLPDSAGLVLGHPGASGACASGMGLLGRANPMMRVPPQQPQYTPVTNSENPLPASDSE